MKRAKLFFNGIRTNQYTPSVLMFILFGALLLIPENNNTLLSEVKIDSVVVYDALNKDDGKTMVVITDNKKYHINYSSAIEEKLKSKPETLFTEYYKRTVSFCNNLEKDRVCEKIQDDLKDGDYISLMKNRLK